VTTGHGLVMSASFITESHEQDLMRKLERLPFPISSGAERMQVNTILFLLVKGIADAEARVGGAPSRFHPPRQALVFLLEARYNSIWKKTTKSFSCDKLLSGSGAIESLVGQAVSLFSQLSDRGVREILLFNYIEALAASGLGDAHSVPAWLDFLVTANCWD